MATSFQTPPPPEGPINTPSTPRFADDFYQPYNPRKSSRISSRAREAKTPPPANNTRARRSPQSSSSMASPSSPQTASKRLPKGPKSDTSGRRVSGALTQDSTALAAASLGLTAPKKDSRAISRSSVTVNNGLLPTPDKTPADRPAAMNPSVKGIARNIFSTYTNEDVMPTPKRKKGKKTSGFTLDMEAEEESTPIPIFTDSNERIPEVDNDADNPFYGEGATSRTARVTKRTMIMVEGEGEQSIEELQKRKDGLVYVFRGRKMFRKFKDDEDGADDVEDELHGAGTESAQGDSISGRTRISTRSSVQPRLLFPPQNAKAHNTEDEEADTDIEEAITPRDAEPVITPTAPRFASNLVSPPTTARATRSKKIDMDSSPGTGDEMINSPNYEDSGDTFSDWRKSKPVKGTKRRAPSPLGGRVKDKKSRA